MKEKEGGWPGENMASARTFRDSFNRKHRTSGFFIFAKPILALGASLLT